MRLADLAAGVPGARVAAGPDVDVTRVVQDSRQAGPGVLFVAVPGLRVDGHQFAAAAAAAGAAVAVSRPIDLPPQSAIVELSDTRAALGELCAQLVGRPGRRLRVAGVTGTDGKTTTTHLAAHLLRHAGLAAGSMSTVAFATAAQGARNESGQTTVEAPEIQDWLARLAAEGGQAAVLEVTSHALVQQRVAGCEFDVAAFTYVGRDHLDYHPTWEDYLDAKARLIDLAAGGADKGIPKTAVLNQDDASFEHLRERRIARRITYSLRDAADVRARRMELDHEGSRFEIEHEGRAVKTRLRLPAAFNVANALAATGIALAFGADLETIAQGIESFTGVPGRLEPVEVGQDFRVYIDFAHSAGALGQALSALRPLTRGRLIAVFGSTARSDHDRPGMGRAAAEGADFFVITTDDPVDQDPAEIAAAVELGARDAGRVPERDYLVELDRRRAIRTAIARARPGDIVLLAGKGHERFMLGPSGKEPWDERREAEAAIRSLGSTAAG